VKVRYNEARYGRSNGYPCASNVCSNTWNLVSDAANQWYNDQIAAGRPAAEVNAELATFDKWDRYDHDDDGNFNEADGYIDHVQAIHAGEGDEAGASADAIWSHRWYVNGTDNNTSDHPGHGQALPIDARPEPFYFEDGTKPGNRRQPFDATFCLQKTDAVCLQKQAMTGGRKDATMETYHACAPSSAGLPEFNDSSKTAYYSEGNPWGSTMTAGSGMRATVLSESGGNITVKVVNP
jgi:hypothetical protein